MFALAILVVDKGYVTEEADNFPKVSLPKVTD